MEKRIMETLNHNESLVVTCLNLDSPKSTNLSIIYDIIDDIRLYGVNRISHHAGDFGISRINYGFGNAYRMELVVPKSLQYFRIFSKSTSRFKQCNSKSAAHAAPLFPASAAGILYFKDFGTISSIE